MREVFANREFKKLFFSNLFSGFGQGMTMIGIAWYLVETTGSAELLGTTMLTSAFLMFFIGPYIGTLIDRLSRKKMMLAEHVIGFTVLAVLSLWGFFGPYAEWMLIAIYLVTTLMYQIHYPAQAALVQESFDSKHYHAINSLLEVEGQTASVLAGGFAGLLLNYFGLHLVLMINALTYLTAYLLMSTMAYTFTLEKEAKQNVGVSWMGQLYQSWQYIRSQKGFLVFGISAMMPFIAIMASNLLSPVYVNQTLKADVTVYSMGEVTYAVGAVAAGLLVSRMVGKVGQLPAMVGNTLLFAVVTIAMVAISQGWGFVAASIFFGWCNSSVRLVRQTLYMNVVPKQVMGRVMSFFNSVGMMMRLLLIGLFTYTVDYTGAGVGYLVLAGLLLLAALGIVTSMRYLLESAQSRATVAAEETSA
ncbi:MFS transporter [Brevibacillus composti]|uniref:MFS transporter n=1 Tax=Brevibacillus composti TaxID=2796470 RepID=A0A7T5JNN4_9BACL|nr:MFS transporter [Brevibacillus composti]QQE74267.1 MFS transporter [Brevibacillus composti]QUO41349.1 MFS transporter [Brevibacillus composti]